MSPHAVEMEANIAAPRESNPAPTYAVYRARDLVLVSAEEYEQAVADVARVALADALGSVGALPSSYDVQFGPALPIAQEQLIAMADALRRSLNSPYTLWEEL